MFLIVQAGTTLTMELMEVFVCVCVGGGGAIFYALFKLHLVAKILLFISLFLNRCFFSFIFFSFFGVLGGGGDGAG
jgi:hypothetical protein